MEPITGVERISKQRWKLVCPDLRFSRLFSIFLFLEMLSLRHSRGGMHSMQQEFLFPGLSRHLCTQGEASDANEGFVWFGTPTSPVFLRKAYACWSQLIFLQIFTEQFTSAKNSKHAPRPSKPKLRWNILKRSRASQLVRMQRRTNLALLSSHRSSCLASSSTSTKSVSVSVASLSNSCVGTGV